MTASHPQWDLEKLSGIFREAGKIALDYFETPPSELKSDSTVVTAADKAIENLLAGYFDKPAENSYMIGEETIEKHSQGYINDAIKSSCCWVLDPIDGTAPYSAHMELWGISLGLMKAGKLVEGAVYMPKSDILIATCGNDLICRNLNPATSWEPFKATVSSLGMNGHISIGQYIARHWTFDGSNTLFSLCCCVGSFYLLLTGKLTAYFGNFKLWDIAGMLPILQRAGFAVLSSKNGNRELSGDLQDDMFEVHDPSSMWKVKSPVFVAPDKNTALTLLKKFHNHE